MWWLRLFCLLIWYLHFGSGLDCIHTISWFTMVALTYSLLGASRSGLYYCHYPLLLSQTVGLSRRIGYMFSLFVVSLAWKQGLSSGSREEFWRIVSVKRCVVRSDRFLPPAGRRQGWSVTATTELRGVTGSSQIVADEEYWLSGLRFLSLATIISACN